MKTTKTYGSIKTAVALLALSAFSIVVLGFTFKRASVEELIVPGFGVTEVKRLSEYFNGIAGTAGDTDVYILKGEKPGPSMLVLGGTHANEPSGFISAVFLIENAVVESGTLYVIPRANNSGFTATDPQEGSPMTYAIETPGGLREFRFGSRATNPVHQWPDPEIYVHAASGSKLSGSETRNINRTYPGRTNGSLTEKVSYAITTMINEEHIDITVDLHEAAPEYPTNNAIVAHERAMPVASFATIYMHMAGMDINLEVSPVNLRGLTHRELGDYTDTLAMLMETPNATQGRLRGRTNEALVLDGKDKFYEQAAGYGLLYVPWDENGHPLVERVARHLTGIIQIIAAYNGQGYGRGELTIENIPSFGELMENGLGYYLNIQKEISQTAQHVLDLTIISGLPPSNPVEGTKTDEWVTSMAFYPEPRVTAKLETYPICVGTDMENNVTVLRGAEPGRAVYIVASVHGDEVAAYVAANNLKNMEIKRGTLYILSPANIPGAINRRRYVYGQDDLNRLFPGNPEGSDAERLAYEIFNDIKNKQPDIVMDLHEAATNQVDRDFLGSSLIFTDLQGIEDMFMGMLMATQFGELCSEPYNFFGPGPIGSINNTVTNQLGIPVITVETYRAYILERRVMDQLAILGYVLRYYGLID